MSATSPLPPSDDPFARIADDLALRGWSMQTDWLPPALLRSLRVELRNRASQGRLTRAGIGRGDDHLIDDRIRRDRTDWLDGSSEPQRQWLASMETLRLALNRRLFLGLFEFEAHFALYPPGGFYRRHLDSLRGSANRLVSVVLYLNENWAATDGGALRLFAPDSDQPITEISPHGGTLAVFLSEEMPHEVLPAQRERLSIAGWFRLNSSLGGAIDPAR